MPRIAAVAGLAVVAVAAGTGALIYWRSQTPPPRQEAPAEPTFSAETAFPATVRARHMVDVPAPVAGTVEELLVEPGQPVYEGQLVMRIKNTAIASEQEAAIREAAAAEESLNRFEGELAALRLEHSRARADFSRAQSEFDRVEKLYQREQLLLSQGATPRKKFEKAESDYQAKRADRDAIEQAARAAEERLTAMQKRVDAVRAERDAKSQELELAREHAAAGDVRVPSDGVLVSTAAGAGEQISADVPNLLRIAVNLSDLDAVVEPPPPVLARVRPGAESLVMFAQTGDALAGTVREVAGSQVIVEFASPNPAIKPGMNAQVRLQLGPAPAAPAATK
ncbi:MAG TPA: biotin/lipoyl-containing protein [Bryobacteraceae bacterium]|nr:biotin/lipoyl-containing protein [Bryobacteraceae bacterium]